MTRYTADFGPNVEQILRRSQRVIRGRIPAKVRAELQAAVKAGVLGHLKRDGLKPEIYFHPDHRNGARERQKREAEYSISCVASVLAVKPVDQRVDEAIASLSRSDDADGTGGDPSPPVIEGEGSRDGQNNTEAA